MKTQTPIASPLVTDTIQELAAPLESLLQHADMLEATELTAEQRGLLDVMRRTALGLKTQIGDLLDLARLDRGQIDIQSAPFDLHETVENAVSVLVPAAYRKGLDLALMIYRDVPTQFIGDAQRVHQILTQLLAVAVNECSEGSIALRVMLEQDGVDQAILRFSLSAGRRAEGLVTPADKSTADPRLTHALNKHLIQLMGGQMQAANANSDSDAYAFLLPLRKPDSGSPPLTWPGLVGRTARVFDDDLLARRALLHHLEAWGVKCLQHGPLTNLSIPSSGGEADIVIMGLRSQNASGAELQHFLASMKARKVPVLSLVASFAEDVHQQLREQGATASLPKSTNRLTLYRVLCRLIGAQGHGEERRLAFLDLPVLVADDVETNRKLLKIMLEQVGAKPTLVSGGREALSAWREKRHRLVLLDVRMPDLDGASVARHIREQEHGGDRCVIVGVTAALDAPLRRQLLDAGMNDCILKPTDRHSLVRDLRPWVIAPNLPSPASTATATSVSTTMPAGSSATKPASSDGMDLRAAQPLLAQNPELTRLLIESLPLQLAGVEDAVKATNPAKAYEELHQLHGTAAFYRLEALKKIAGELEARCRKDRLLIADQLPPLREAVEQVLAALRTL